MNSYWEHSLTDRKRYDFLIIGGGILGHFCAFELKEKYPRALIGIMEREEFGYGATSRNAGFACFGTVGEFLSDCDLSDESTALTTLIGRKKGLEKLLARFNPDDLGYIPCGGNELLDKSQTHILDHVEKTNFIIANSGGPEKTFSISSDSIFSSQVEGLIFNKYEGVVRSDLVMISLHREARRLGIDHLFGYEAQSIDSFGHKVSVSAISCYKSSLQNKVLKERGNLLEFTTRHLVVATNGHTNKLLPQFSKITPQLGQVLVTQPLPLSSKFNSGYHFNEGFYYFRPLKDVGEIGTRILMGGGRNFDFEQENNCDIKLNEKIISHLLQFTQDIFKLPIIPKIEYKWAGLMGFSENKQPFIETNGRVSVLLSCNGMGIALSPYIASIFAKNI